MITFFWLPLIYTILYLITFVFVDRKSKPLSLTKECFQINEPILTNYNIETSALPRFSCLILSPANIWKNDVNKFLQDATIIKTIFNTKDFSYLDSGNLREILFGVPWTETGIKPFYVRNRQRTITFAITVFFSRYNANLIKSLTEQLRERYPVYPFNSSPNDLKEVENFLNQIIHMHFQYKLTFSEYSPLIVTYIILFACIYFSVRK